MDEGIGTLEIRIDCDAEEAPSERMVAKQKHTRKHRNEDKRWTSDDEKRKRD